MSTIYQRGNLWWYKERLPGQRERGADGKRVGRRPVPVDSRAGNVGHQASGVEACLVACHVVDPQTLVPAAIDELERIVGAAYRVGLGLGRFNAGEARGWIPDHVRTASALLTAYEITGRLPYSMLAEELVQFVRRTKWGEAAGRFEEPELDDRALFVVNCDAARVLSRLAHLHGRDDYRAGAVMAAGAAYDEDAGRILTACGDTYQVYGTATSAAFGLALMEWLTLR